LCSKPRTGCLMCLPKHASCPLKNCRGWGLCFGCLCRRVGITLGQTGFEQTSTKPELTWDTRDKTLARGRNPAPFDI
jgi:hypothetical protein